MTDKNLVQKEAVTEDTFEDKVRKLEESYATIKLSDIEQEVAELDRQETYVVDGVTNQVIKYYPIFDQNKIDELLIELQEKAKYIEENKINFLKTDEELYKYLYFLIIKHFTHFSDEIADDFETQLAQMNALVRLGYYELILDEILDPSQITRVLDKYFKIGALADKINSLQLDAQLNAEEVLQKAETIKKSVKTKAKPKTKTTKKSTAKKK